MRNLIVTAFVLAACGGPSGKEVAMAKQARFTGDKLQLFGVVKGATEAKYKLAKSDEQTLGMQTEGKWYSPEGLPNSASSDDVRDLVDKSINLTLVVELLPEGGNWVVAVHAVMFRFNKGQPKPDKLDEKDPSVPGWVSGKVDQLHFAIYNKLKPYEVKSPGGLAPAPAPAPAPAAGSDGSAAAPAGSGS